MNESKLSPTITPLELRYNELKKESHRYGETNDCTVITTAMLFDLTYDAAHKLLYSLGRRTRYGMNGTLIENHFSNRCGNQIHIKQPNDSQYTVKTIINALPVGKYMVYTSGHVLACIDGKIYDWTEDRKHRVVYIVQIDSLMMDLL